MIWNGKRIMTGDQGEDLSVEPYGPPAWFFLAPQLFLAVLRPSEAEPLLWRSRLAGLGHAGAEELVELRRRPRSTFRHPGVGGKRRARVRRRRVPRTLFQAAIS